MPAGGRRPLGGDECSPGERLLIQIGRDHPHLMLLGDALRHQGLMATGRLEEGYSPEALYQVLTQPLPENTRSVPAVISWRLANLPSLPRQRPHAAAPAPAPQAEPEPRLECGCGEPVGAPGDRCPACAGWPACDGGCGRLLPPPGGTCGACEYASWPACEGGCGQHLPDGGTCDNCAYAAEMTVPTAPDGTCAGQGQHRGDCGYPVRAYGMCGRCLVIAQNERRQRRDDEWEAAVAAAAAAADAPDDRQAAV
ncbi:hypothetical protein ADL27_56955 [Streptomyces sp. NRRL F-6602]|nr:hypothetical protein ADL27_56955 [Streptomyces sp. NRRL F-6602]